MLQWIAATIVVLALVVVLGRVAAWAVRRVSTQGGMASEMGTWKVTPDARVRAIRVQDRVHFLYERGRQTTLLDSRSLEDYETAAQQPETRALAPRAPHVPLYRRLASLVGS